MASLGEMMRSSISSSNTVVCPKPRRIGAVNPFINEQIWCSGSQINYFEEDVCESNGSELINIIISKGNNGRTDHGDYLVSSSPYFYGSPPNRASNPLIQDSEFGKITLNNHFSPTFSSHNTGSSCALTKIGHKPVAVRIEGFECLNRNISIVA